MGDQGLGLFAQAATASAAAARSQHSAAIRASDGVRADPFDSEINGWPQPHAQFRL